MSQRRPRWPNPPPGWIVVIIVVISIPTVVLATRFNVEVVAYAAVVSALIALATFAGFAEPPRRRRNRTV